MGLRILFACPQCDYRAEVSGGPDAGFEICTVTITCQDCHKLYDIISADVNGLDAPTDRPLRCPRSARHHFQPWLKGGPCPQCSYPMEEGDECCLWD